MNKVLLAVTLLLGFTALASARTAGELFSGTFAYVNYTVMVNGKWQGVYLDGTPVGHIMYMPEYPGATSGNVSVNFGQTFPPPHPPSAQQMVDSRSAYGGPYYVNETGKYVDHVPGYMLAWKSSLLELHTSNIRYYEFSDNDNLLKLYLPNIVDVFWRRVFPFTDSCQVSANLQTVNSWVENAQIKNQYAIVVKNNGATPITSVRVTLAGAITSSWNIQREGNTDYYTISFPGGIAPGQTVSSSGFISTGATLFSLRSTKC